MNIGLMCNSLLMGNNSISQIKFMIIQFINRLFVSGNLFSSSQSKILMLVVQIGELHVFLSSHVFHFCRKCGSGVFVGSEMFLSVALHLVGEVGSEIFFFEVELSSFFLVVVGKSFSSVFVILGHLVLGSG